MPTGMPDLAKRIFVAVAGMVDRAPGGNVPSEKLRRRNLIKNANNALGDVSWEGMSPGESIAAMRRVVSDKVLQQIPGSVRAEMPGNGNSIGEVLNAAARSVNAGRRDANAATPRQANQLPSEPSTADVGEFVRVANRTSGTSPARADSGRMRNIRAMSDSKLLALWSQMTRSSDRSALVAVAAEMLRRGVTTPAVVNNALRANEPGGINEPRDRELTDAANRREDQLRDVGLGERVTVEYGVADGRRVTVTGPIQQIQPVSVEGPTATVTVGSDEIPYIAIEAVRAPDRVDELFTGGRDAASISSDLATVLGGGVTRTDLPGSRPAPTPASARAEVPNSPARSGTGRIRNLRAMSDVKLTTLVSQMTAHLGSGDGDAVDFAGARKVRDEARRRNIPHQDLQTRIDAWRPEGLQSSAPSLPDAPALSPERESSLIDAMNDDSTRNLIGLIENGGPNAYLARQALEERDVYPGADGSYSLEATGLDDENRSALQAAARGGYRVDVTLVSGSEMQGVEVSNVSGDSVRLSNPGQPDSATVPLQDIESVDRALPSQGTASDDSDDDGRAARFPVLEPQDGDSESTAAARGFLATLSDDQLDNASIAPHAGGRYTRIQTLRNPGGGIRANPRTIAYVQERNGRTQLTLTRGSREELDGGLRAVSADSRPSTTRDSIGINGTHYDVSDGIDGPVVRGLLEIAINSNNRGGSTSTPEPSTTPSPTVSRYPTTRAFAEDLVRFADSQLPGDETSGLQIADASGYSRIIDPNGDTVAYVRAGGRSTAGGQGARHRVTFTRGDPGDYSDLSTSSGHAASLAVGHTVDVHSSDYLARGNHYGESARDVTAADEYEAAGRMLLLARSALPMSSTTDRRNREPRRARPAAPAAPPASRRSAGLASIDGNTVPQPDGTIEGRVFGVENEIVMRGATRASRGMSNTAIRALENAGIPVHNRHLYYHQHSDRPMASWRSMEDPSARGGPEMVSPPLVGEEGFDNLRRTLTALAAAGGRQGRQTTHGLHVHIDVRDLTADQKDAVIETYRRNGEAIDELVAINRRGVHYAGGSRRVINQSHGAALNTQHMNGARGTLEFRRLGSNMDPQFVSDWVALLRALVQHAKDTGQPMPRVNSLHDMLALLPDAHVPADMKRRLEQRVEQVRNRAYRNAS